MKSDISVQIGSLKMANPVMVASGTFAYGEEYSEGLDLNTLGAIVVKSVTVTPRKGNPGPRTAETPSGMLNSIGLQNVGVEGFIAKKLPFLRRFRVPLIVNIAGNTVEEYAEIAQRLAQTEGIAALELNLSCPNVKEGGLILGTDPKAIFQTVRAVKKVSPWPVITKLTPNVTDIVEIARAAVEGGSDGLAMINTLIGMAIDVRTRRPKIASITGGLSGPAIRPIAVRMVWQVHRAFPDIPIVGMGGVEDADSALEFILAGACCVAVGTANFYNVHATTQIVQGIREYLRRNKIARLADLIGEVQVLAQKKTSTTSHDITVH